MHKTEGQSKSKVEGGDRHTIQPVEGNKAVAVSLARRILVNEMRRSPAAALESPSRVLRASRHRPAVSPPCAAADRRDPRRAIFARSAGSSTKRSRAADQGS